MKTDVNDPWCGVISYSLTNTSCDNCFEDSFVSQEDNKDNFVKLLDSDQYLDKLYSKLNSLQGGTTKKDLVNSLSTIKEDCLARLITAGQKFQSEEEAELASNPVIRHIVPHMQALTATELIHLLKADVLQIATTDCHKVE
ncbi:uncharacterized protein [Prorops nasuta]|uniref:uncharacterized protein n=1 Tax=Prorops nasuta TaxID=863751 RepID=UPI0034CD14EF